jgi:cystathionine beta-lyase
VTDRGRLLGARDPVAVLSALQQRTSEKWRRHGHHVLPSYIAEMDLPVAQELLTAIGDRLVVTGGDLGYAYSFTADSPAQRALAGWLRDRFDWSAPTDRILYYADVMRVVEAGIDAFSKPGDAILVDLPGYPGFFEALRERDREVVGNPMVQRNGRWQIDIAGVERACRDGVSAYLLCSPHNPTGALHTRAELAMIAEITSAYRVPVVCDEVHSPLVYPGRRHYPFAPIAHRTKTLTAVSASKAWNIAGLKCAFGIPGDAEVLEALLAQPTRQRDGVGILGVAATEAAYTKGGRWLDDTLRYLGDNRRLLSRLIATELPEIGFTPPAATYLAWLDCRRVADRFGGDLAGQVLRDGDLAATDGIEFGREGFLRLNFATMRPLIGEMIRRLADGLGTTVSDRVSAAA